MLQVEERNAPESTNSQACFVSAAVDLVMPNRMAAYLIRATKRHPSIHRWGE